MFHLSHLLGDDALPNGLDVTFEVTELRRLTGSYNTMVGNNEGSMVRHGLSLPEGGAFHHEVSLLLIFVYLPALGLGCGMRDL